MKSRIIIFISALFVIALSVLIIYKLQDNTSESKTSLKQENIIPKKILNEFGLYTDSLKESVQTIKRNQTFGSILSSFKIKPEFVLNIKEASKDVFNIRKIIIGDKYYTYCADDSISSLEYLVYQKDPINYVVFDFTDSVNVYTGAKKVEVRTRTISGEINYSLYNSLSENDADPELILRLAKVYAWQIDFFRLQKGDNYKVIYEENYVDDEPVGINKIIAADFKHDNENFYAIRFEQENRSEFFDQDGNSLMKAFLKAPLEYSRISSRYSKHRFHPILKRYKAHLGTDYAAPTGTPIHSVGDGVVIEASYSRGNGRFVKIRHNGVYTTQYLHMSRIAKGIRPGTRVKQGETIGYVGSTGLATGPHLCYRLWRNGVQVDPLKEKLPPSHPVKEENLNAFTKKKEEILKELKGISISSEEKNNTPT